MRIAMLAAQERQASSQIGRLPAGVVSLLCKGLRDRGIDVTLFEIPGEETEEVRCVEAPDRRTDAVPELPVALRISQVFERARDFDVIHNHLGSFPLTYAGLVSRPVLTTLHGLPRSGRLSVYRRYNQRCYYVSTSNAERSPELSYLATVYPAVDTGALPFEGSPEPYFLICGPIHPRAGIHEAMDIAAATDADLVIAGRVLDRNYFEREIEPRIDGKRIRRCEPAEPQGRNGLVCNARALLHLETSFDLSLLEANACGTPAIVVKGGAAEEVIRDGVNGFLVADSREAIRAVQDIDSISRSACREMVERRFSPSRMVDVYVQVYEKILADTGTEERRPWGYYEVLCDEPDHKVKRIVVWPGKRLSLQRHQHRAEHWTVVQGEPIVTVDDEDFPLRPGDSIAIPLGARHRIANPGDTDVAFIEVQTGTSFAEHDIERFEDDFGRVREDRAT